MRVRIARRNLLQSSAREVPIGDEVAVETALLMAVSAIRQRSARALMTAIAVRKAVHLTGKIPPLLGKGVMKAVDAVDHLI